MRRRDHPNASHAIPSCKRSKLLHFSPYLDTDAAYPFDGGFAVLLSSNTYAGGGGSCDGGRQFYVGLDDPNYDKKAATLLAAYLAGHEAMILWQTEGTGTCRAHINRLQIRR